jgi:hypothetical protein
MSLDEHPARGASTPRTAIFATCFTGAGGAATGLSYPSGERRLAALNLAADPKGAFTSAAKDKGRFEDGDHHRC